MYKISWKKENNKIVQFRDKLNSLQNYLNNSVGVSTHKAVLLFKIMYNWYFKEFQDVA